MAATIIVEDGSTVAGANSYVSLADAETYFETHVYGTEWDAATDDVKNRALISAARTIDPLFEWKGNKTLDGNPMEWPRELVYLEHDYYSETAVPQDVADAQCEQALAMLKEDRLTDPEGTGISEVGLGKGALSVKFDSSKTKAMAPRGVRALLRKWTTGGSIGGKGTIPIRRV